MEASIVRIHVHLNGVPKAGNHLLYQIPRKLGTGCYRLERAKFLADYNKAVSALPEYPRKRNVIVWIDHMKWAEEEAKCYEKFGVKMVFILRDPRDVVTSWYRAVMLVPAHSPLKPLFERCGQEVSISGIITGNLIGKQLDAIFMPSSWKKIWLPWMNCDFCYTTYFERLVGTQGGGDDEAQVAELRRVIDFIGFELDEEKLNKLAAGLFTTETDVYRPGGGIGVWKKYFTNENVKVFKDHSGDLLQKLGYEKDGSWGL